MNKTNVLLVLGSLIVGIGIGVAFVFSWFAVGPPNFIVPPCVPFITTGDCVVLPPSSPVATSTPETTSTPEQSGKIDEHLTIDLVLRDVNFCGKTYKVKQVIIDGVDVVQRVAELATKGLIPETFERYPYAKDHGPRLSGNQVSTEICEYVYLKTATGILQIDNRGIYRGRDVGLLSEWIYIVNIINSSFVIDNLNGDIYIYGGIGLEGTGLEGGLEGPIGALR